MRNARHRRIRRGSRRTDRIIGQKIKGKVYTSRSPYCGECEKWYMKQYLREYMPGYLKRRRENDKRRKETVNARGGDDRRPDRG